MTKQGPSELVSGLGPRGGGDKLLSVQALGHGREDRRCNFWQPGPPCPVEEAEPTDGGPETQVTEKQLLGHVRSWGQLQATDKASYATRK